MDTIQNKVAIQFLYDSILNNKHYDKLPELVSKDYINTSGGKGIEEFQKTMLELSNAFPDAHWEVEDILGEGNKVVVKQKFTGTQAHIFQTIPPTSKSVSVEGIATYEFQNGKIVRSQVHTDRLGFLQQLAVLPSDLSTLINNKSISNAVYFIDKFSVPKASIEEFKKQMNYNREFIKTLSGYVKGEAVEHYDKEGHLTIMTIAVWENPEKMKEAKVAVQSAFKNMGFNPTEFYQRLDIKIERGEYTSVKE